MREQGSTIQGSWPTIWTSAFQMRRAGRVKLVQRLLEHSGSSSREQALLLIGSFGLPGFQVPIRQGLASRYVRVRVAACSAAAGTDLLDSIEAIAGLATADSSYRVRLWAIQALKRLGDHRWRSIALVTEMRRLNPNEWADWKILIQIAQGTRKDKHPRSSVNAMHYD